MYFKVVTPSEPVTSLFDVLSWQLAGSDGENMTQKHRNSGAIFVKLNTTNRDYRDQILIIETETETENV